MSIFDPLGLAGLLTPQGSAVPGVPAWLQSPAVVIGGAALVTLALCHAVGQASAHRDQLERAARSALPLMAL